MAGKSSDPPNPPDDAPDRPGAVVHDASGKAVWKWSSESDSTSKLLKKLEVPGLAIQDEPQPKPDKPSAPQQSRTPSVAGEFNPYGDAGINRAPTRPPAPSAKPAAGGRQGPVTKPQAAPPAARRRGWFSRLFGGKD